MELWERDSYKTPVKALFNHRIVEYDMKSANTSIAREFGLLPEKRIKELVKIFDMESFLNMVEDNYPIAIPKYLKEHYLGYYKEKQAFIKKMI